MAQQPYVEFTPSQRDTPPGRSMGPVPGDQAMTVSLYLKPRSTEAGTRAEILARRSAEHADDFKKLRRFAKGAGLTIAVENPARRLMQLSGPASAMEAAFHTKLAHYRHEDAQFRGRSGALSLPADIAGIVEAVLGLDTRPQARRHLRFRPAAKAGTSFLPNAVGKLYGFPSTVTGAGETIALIELGGGYLDSDNAAAFSAMGLQAPSVTAVPVDGGANKPTPDDGADAEVALDLQVAGGNAPGAKFAVYFSPNTDAGFVDAITTATADAVHKPSIISISWGGPESSWSAQGLAAMNSALQDAAAAHISVFVAAGDNLATDGVSDGKAHVDFPASSPWAIGCGGTLITVAKGAITKETVWNEGTSGTGGGISDVYAVPSFQAGVKLPKTVSGGKAGRGVPDVAGNADPASGYSIVVNGQTEVVGGTSAVAPLWAGLTALVNQAAGGTPAGFFLPKLYGAPGGAVREITSGTNKPKGSKIGYAAGPGWNACSGLGVPVGAGIVALLAPRVG